MVGCGYERIKLRVILSCLIWVIGIMGWLLIEMRKVIGRVYLGWGWLGVSFGYEVKFGSIC